MNVVNIKVGKLPMRFKARRGVRMLGYLLLILSPLLVLWFSDCVAEASMRPIEFEVEIENYLL